MAHDLDVLGVIAAGGVLGSVAGCLLIGALLWFVLEVWVTGRYARPFLAVGVLGGFTTFSTYSVETLGLLREGAAGTAVSYAAGSLVVGLLAVRAGRRLAAVAAPRRREH
ncbi:MAG: CrcB family protein [Actinomycetia bacterium]|nr:CrcB family protein [Actinomycetes bacterium]